MADPEVQKGCIAYIGLGSNLDGPEVHVRRALGDLSRLPHTRFLSESPLYRSVPMGPADQPDYINAVAAVETGLAPEALLDALQAIEREHHRVRDIRWGPRTLDLDLLLYGDAVIATPRLTVPHPGLGERAFVLYPLADIAPELRLPDGTGLQALLRRVPPEGIRRMNQRPGAKAQRRNE